MGLRADLRKVINARAEVGRAIAEKTRERETIRKRKHDKKKRDPKDENRERRLDREISKLAAEEEELTKRIGQLKDRDEELHEKAEEIRKEARSQRPDFNGHPANVNDDCEAIVVIATNRFDVEVTSTTDGVHSPTSYHPRGMAVDFGAAVDMKDALALQEWCWEHAELFLEVFGPANDKCVKNGVRITLGEGTDLENLHDNHDHIAPYPGAFS